MERKKLTINNITNKVFDLLYSWGNLVFVLIASVYKLNCHYLFLLKKIFEKTLNWMNRKTKLVVNRIYEQQKF